MPPLLGRTVSQIKNRYYQNLKGKDLGTIKYKNAASPPCASEVSGRVKDAKMGACKPVSYTHLTLPTKRIV